MPTHSGHTAINTTNTTYTCRTHTYTHIHAPKLNFFQIFLFFGDDNFNLEIHLMAPAFTELSGGHVTLQVCFRIGSQHWVLQELDKASIQVSLDGVKKKKQYSLSGSLFMLFFQVTLLGIVGIRKVCLKGSD